MARLSGRPLLDTKADKRLFADRKSELRDVRRSIEHGANVLLLGTRGSGRTSFLQRLAGDLRTDGWRIVLVEGPLARDASEFLSLLEYRLAPAQEAVYTPPNRLPLGTLAAAFRSLNLPVSRARRPGGFPGESEELLELLRAIQARLGAPKQRHAVFVDELPSSETAHTLFGRLRDELWQLPVTWALAGNAADRGTYVRPPADAFFPKVVELDPLDDEAAFRLLRLRIAPEEAGDRLLKEIIEEAGGNPRALVRLASDALVGRRGPAHAAAARQERARLAESLGEPAKRLIAELEANGPASASDQRFLERLGWSRSRAAQVFGDLEDAGLVRGTSARWEGSRPRKVYELVEVEPG